MRFASGLGNRAVTRDLSWGVRGGRIKPCGGAIPPRLIEEFGIPHDLLVARINSARMISPANQRVDMPIDGGFVGMVDREHFDEFLRTRAAAAGADRFTGTFLRIERDEAGPTVVYRDKQTREERRLNARFVIGADGARSDVARAEVPGGDKIPYVIAYHEIINLSRADEAPSETVTVVGPVCETGDRLGSDRLLPPSVDPDRKALGIRRVVRKSLGHRQGRPLAEEGDAVMGLLAEVVGNIAQFLDHLPRKGVVRHLRFLDPDDVRIVSLLERLELVTPAADAVDVEGDESHVLQPF